MVCLCDRTRSGIEIIDIEVANIEVINIEVINIEVKEK